ncbi:hypothetical protein EPR50_G00059310 [Perca flavescens]|uniref:Uncharacterized protein n=1 Tax=Perca flavescens TaxID=8167 RepID=A0A484D7T3_PERFV|nr:hypothetical protein EPR50_G00059310 [Perca flavescens]
MAEGEVNYASVVFKNNSHPPPQARKEEETVYDEVKGQSNTTEETAVKNTIHYQNALPVCWSAFRVPPASLLMRSASGALGGVFSSVPGKPKHHRYKQTTVCESITD